MLRRALIRKELLQDEAAVSKLLVELDCLPLAITQAAAYTNCNMVSLRRYTELVADTEQNMVHILSIAFRDKTRYRQAANAVATTWLLSFGQTMATDEDAAELFRYMACLEWKAIPHSILPAMEPAARMDSAVATLCSYSFVTRRDSGSVYDLHRLVHIAARVWMREEGSLQRTQTKALQQVMEIFPSDVYENREVWRQYIPHAARVKLSDSGVNAELRGTLCLWVGRCLQVDGRMRDAVQWLEESRDWNEALAENHPSRLASQHALAHAYLANGQVREAVELLEYVVAVHKVALAEDHPSRLASQRELARMYWADGQPERAI